MQVEDERRHADQYKEQVGGARGPATTLNCVTRQGRVENAFGTLNYGISTDTQHPCSQQL